MCWRWTARRRWTSRSGSDCEPRPRCSTSSGLELMFRLKLANSVTFDRMRRTLEHLRRIVLPDHAGINGESSLKSSTAGNQHLIDVLLSRSPPTWSKSLSEPVQWLGDRLNDSQKDAIEFCLTADHVACIHGPPGVRVLLRVGIQLIVRRARRTRSSSSSFKSSRGLPLHQPPRPASSSLHLRTSHSTTSCSACTPSLRPRRTRLSCRPARSCAWATPLACTGTSLARRWTGARRTGMMGVWCGMWGGRSSSI